MIDQNVVIGIYNQLTTAKCPDGAYFLIHVYDSFGSIDQKVLSESYLQVTKEELVKQDSYFGPFFEINDLNKFMFILCQKLDLKQALAISTFDFNLVLDSSDNVDALARGLFEKANVIDNIDKAEKSGFFNRFFKD